MTNEVKQNDFVSVSKADFDELKNMAMEALNKSIELNKLIELYVKEAESLQNKLKQEMMKVKSLENDLKLARMLQNSFNGNPFL